MEGEKKKEHKIDKNHKTTNSPLQETNEKLQIYNESTRDGADISGCYAVDLHAKDPQ